MELTEQHLPNYSDAYLHFNGWRNFESEHYVFHVMPDSVAEREIVLITERQERAWKRIVSALELTGPFKTINYYFYPDVESKRDLMGDDGFAQAVWRDNSVHAVYSGGIKPLGEHEDSHLLTLPLGISVGLMQEGLAEWLSGCKWAGKDCAVHLKGRKKPELRDMLSHEGWIEACADFGEAITYPMAALFVRDFVRNYGICAFRDAFRSINRRMSRTEVEKALSGYPKSPTSSASTARRSARQSTAARRCGTRL